MTSSVKNRRLVQLYAAILYNANLKGFLNGRIYTGPLKGACVPGLNCYSCPGAAASCPLGALQNALGAAGHTAPWYILGILSLFGVTLGRTICGWLCPFGLLQELLHTIPVPKIKKSIVTRYLSFLKYILLAVFVIVLPVWYGVIKGLPMPAFCKYICPAGTLEGAVGLLQNEANATSFYQLKLLFTNKWVVMLSIALACAFCYRSFCRFLCPLGAIYGFFNKFALTGIRVDAGRCNGCSLCVRHCQMDVRHAGDHECISCGKCMDHCAQGAISIKAGKITLAGPVSGTNADPDSQIRKRRQIGRIAWGAALALMLFALVWFNLPAPVSNQSAAGSGQTGTAVGEILPDFRTDLLGGGTFHLEEYRGRKVILNFWAITCAPCIEELPYYEKLKTERPDLEILAIHHRAGAKKAEAFLADKGWDHLDFALDSKEKGLYAFLEVSDALPHTIILNESGEVIYNAQASLTYEQISALVE